MAGLWVEKAIGVVYLPGLGFMCSLGGGRGSQALAPNLHLLIYFFAEIKFGKIFAEPCSETAETRTVEQDRV